MYCLKRESAVGDHIFAREFFIPSKRADLPKCPSCVQCNADKSKLEHYLTAVLPFGGRHEDGYNNLVSQVPPRLKRNQSLHRKLSNGIGKIWHVENGVYRRSMIIPIDHDKIIDLFRYITKGLVWYHWKVLFRESDCVDGYFLSDDGSILFNNLFQMRSSEHVEGDLGGGTVFYEGAKGLNADQITVWRYKMYGGIVYSGDPDAPDVFCSEIGVLTGPKNIS